MIQGIRRLRIEAPDHAFAFHSRRAAALP
jgi:hypothetical protein